MINNEMQDSAFCALHLLFSSKLVILSRYCVSADFVIY